MSNWSNLYSIRWIMVIMVGMIVFLSTMAVIGFLFKTRLEPEFTTELLEGDSQEVWDVIEEEIPEMDHSRCQGFLSLPLEKRRESFKQVEGQEWEFACVGAHRTDKAPEHRRITVLATPDGGRSSFTRVYTLEDGTPKFWLYEGDIFRVHRVE